jgi:hypothetical protein
VNRPRGGGVQLELPPRVRGFGRYWDGYEGDGWPPHPAAFVAALASFAGMKVEHLDIKNLD